MPKKPRTQAQIEAFERNLRPHSKTRKDYSYNMSDYQKDGGWDREKLLKDARRVAKSTNQRLVRLEKAGYTSAPAYRGAVKNVSGDYNDHLAVAYGGINKDNHPRYKERGLDKLTNEQLSDMLFAMSHTQQAKTATPSQVKKLYSKEAKRLSKAVGSVVNEDDVMNLLSSKGLKEYVKQYGYKAVLQLAGDLKDKGQNTAEIERNLVNLFNTKESLLEVKKAVSKQPTLLFSGGFIVDN